MSGTLREELLAIREARGVLTPEVVVEEATPPHHPLHHRFEWDDAIAGPLYRREQGAHLIRSVRVRDMDRPGGRYLEHDVRAFISIGRADARSCEYVPVEEAMADEFTRRLVLRDAEREWRALRRRYDHLVEFAEMVRGDLDEASGT